MEYPFDRDPRKADEAMFAAVQARDAAAREHQQEFDAKFEAAFARDERERAIREASALARTQIDAQSPYLTPEQREEAKQALDTLASGDADADLYHALRARVVEVGTANRGATHWANLPTREERLARLASLSEEERRSEWEAAMSVAFPGARG